MAVDMTEPRRGLAYRGAAMLVLRHRYTRR